MPRPSGRLKHPQVISRRGEDLTERGHVIQLEDRIGVGLRSLEFRGKAAVGGHLLRHEDLLELPAAFGQQLLVAGEPCEAGDLQARRRRRGCFSMWLPFFR